jgi:multiple antibiotic resistance protein
VLSFAISVFVSYLTIVDPVGLAPTFLGLTSHLSTVQRKAITTRAIVISAIIIVFFGVVGRLLLNSLGIDLYAFDIAGGALLFLVAVDMLFGRPSGARETKAEEEEAMTREDISVFPLAIPLIAGPGTIATTILYVGTAMSSPFEMLAVAISVAVTLLIAWLVMRASTWIIQHVGRTGILVLSRILGIILAALAVQFILNGVTMYGHGSGLLK